MSKQALQTSAYKNSGISYKESQEAINAIPSMYERIGKEDGFQKLSQLFYDRVFADKENKWFINIFASSTKQEAVDNQYRFFVQTFGGPDLYKEKKGKYTRLVGRHANYHIGSKAAIRWVELMCMAIDNHHALQQDEEAKILLKNYFNYTAHYIVAASVYMRSDQLSGGTQIDADRVW